MALRPLTMFGAPDADQVYYASLYISPTGATIGQEVYPAGFGFGFQGLDAGVTVNVLAKVDPVKMSLSFDGSVSQFTVGPLTIGPVSLHFKASPTTFEFTFDGSMQLGPGEVDLGLIKIGGQLGASVHLSISTSEISAWSRQRLGVRLGLPVARDLLLQGRVAVSVRLVVGEDGLRLHARQDRFHHRQQRVDHQLRRVLADLALRRRRCDVVPGRVHGDTPDPKTALWDPVAPPTIHVAPYSPSPSRTLTA